MATVEEGRVLLFDGLGNYLRTIEDDVLESYGGFSIQSKRAFNDDGTLLVAANLDSQSLNRNVLVYNTTGTALVHKFSEPEIGNFRRILGMDICGTQNDGFVAVFVTYGKLGPSGPGSGSGSGSGIPLIINDSVVIFKISDGSELTRFDLPSEYQDLEDSMISIKGNETSGATVVISFENSYVRTADGTYDRQSEGEAYILCVGPDGTVDTTIMENVTSTSGYRSSGSGSNSWSGSSSGSGSNSGSGSSGSGFGGN